MIQTWAITAVNLCHAYDPSVVILSGGAVELAGTRVEQIERYLHQHLWSSVPRPTVVVADDPARSVRARTRGADPDHSKGRQMSTVPPDHRGYDRFPAIPVPPDDSDAGRVSSGAAVWTTLRQRAEAGRRRR